MNQNSARKVHFSVGVRGRFSDAEREKLAAEFVRHFKKSGRQFIEKPLGGGDVLICNVTPKLYQIVLEEEW